MKLNQTHKPTSRRPGRPAGPAPLVRVLVLVDAPLMERVREVAERDDRSVSSIVRRALVAQLDAVQHSGAA
jgi:hypothetical protein